VTASLTVLFGAVFDVLRGVAAEVDDVGASVFDRSA
jgi:hypothetical protein